MDVYLFLHYNGRIAYWQHRSWSTKPNIFTIWPLQKQSVIAKKLGFYEGIGISAGERHDKFAFQTGLCGGCHGECGLRQGRTRVGRPAVSYFSKVYRPCAKRTMSQFSLYHLLHQNIIHGSSMLPSEWIYEWMGKRRWEKPVFWHWKQ